MNKLIATRIRTARRADDGFSIVEILVAALIFVIISVAIAQSMVNAIRLAGDGQHRSVALNLASTDIDKLKSLNNPYAISSTATPITTVVDGITYSLSRSASWVSVSGNEISCKAQSGNFQLLRVRDRVTWGGQMSSTLPVNIATTISPQNTIISPTTATLFISVSKADGTPDPGVTPTVTSSTGTTVTAPATNSDGCSYLSGVKADTYTVRISSTGQVDDHQNSTGVPKTDPTVVTAGSSVPVLFAFDQAATVGLTYGPTGGGAILPSNFWTTYSSTSLDPYYSSGTPVSVSLFPVTSGYSVVGGRVTAAAGGYGGCQSPDPANWTAGNVSGTALKAGVDPANAVATAGGTSSYSVVTGKGTVSTSGPGWVKLTSSNSTFVSGDPGCPNNASGAQQSYTYPVLGGTSTLAIPYGAWTATFTSFWTGSTTNVPVNPANAYPTSASTNFTVDPRTP